MDAEDGPYQALVLYKDELLKIRDQLTVMEQQYRTTDEQVGATFDGGAL